jgi:hypothetical protein
MQENPILYIVQKNIFGYMRQSADNSGAGSRVWVQYGCGAIRDSGVGSGRKLDKG